MERMRRLMGYFDIKIEDAALDKLRRGREEIASLSSDKIEEYWETLSSDFQDSFREWAEELLRQEEKGWDTQDQKSRDERIENRAVRMATEAAIIDKTTIDILGEEMRSFPDDKLNKLEKIAQSRGDVLKTEVEKLCYMNGKYSENLADLIRVFRDLSKGNSEVKIKKAVFDMLIEIMRRQAKNKVDKSVSGIVNTMRQDDNQLSQTREIVYLPVIIARMGSRIGDKEEELKAAWDKADSEQLEMFKSSLVEKIVLKAVLEEKREERIKEFIDTQILAGNPALAEAVYDIYDRDRAKAKAELFNTIVEKNKEESKELIGTSLTKNIERLLADDKVVENLREAIERKNAGIVLGAIWKDKTFGELKEAMLDVNDRNEAEAKKALLNELVRINERQASRDGGDRDKYIPVSDFYRSMEEVVRERYGFGDVDFIGEMEGGVAGILKPVLIEADHRRYVLRRMYAFDDIDAPDKIRYVISFMRILKEHAVSVPSLVKTVDSKNSCTDGYFIYVPGNGYFLLEEDMPGICVARAEAEKNHLIALAQLAAAIDNSFTSVSLEGIADWKSRDELFDIDMLRESFASRMKELAAVESSQGLSAAEKFFMDNVELYIQQLDLYEKNYSELTFKYADRLVRNHIHDDIIFRNVVFNHDGSIAGLFDFGLIGFDFRVEVFNNLVLEDLERGEIEFNSDDLVLILKQYQNFVDKNLSEEEIRLAIEILRFRFIEAFYRMFVKGGQSDVTNNGEKLDYAMRAQKSFLRFLDRCASSKTIGDFVREITGCTECLYSEKAVSVNFPAADVRITIGVNGKNEFFSTVKREAGSVYEDELAVLRKAMDSALKMMMKNDFTKVLAWLGDDKYREIKLNIHGREGVVCEADVQRNELYLSWRAMRAPPEWNAVPASYAGELSLSLPFFLYHGLRHLIVRGQSEAIVQFNVIEQLRETLKETPEVLNAYLKIISPSLDNGITGTDFWFNILSAIQKKQVLQFSASVPLSQTEILVSVDARYNDRVNLNHADPSMTTYINDLPWDGVLPFPDVDIHIDSMRAEIGDRDYLVIPQCNPYINDHVIIFQGGRIYHRRGEFNRNGFAVHAGKERTYTCLVVYKNGKTAIERLRLLKDMAGISDKVYLDSKDVTSDVLLAMYGQQIVRDGMVFDPAEREFDSPGEFPDHRQLQGKYSHDLLALNDRGELQVLSLSGNRKEGVGVTIRQAAEFAVSQGARDAVLFSNGGDVNLRLNEHMVAESPAGYNPVKTFSSAVIAVAFPRGAARIESSFDGGIRARRIAHGVKSQEELQEMIGLGFTIFEVDVQMTSDKKLTAYWDTIDEKCVYDYTFEQLKAKLEPSMEYKLLDIAEMLEVIHDNNLTVYLDLKDWPTYKYNKGMNQEYNKYEDYQRLFLDEIKAQVERFGLENQVFAGAFNFDYLRELKRSTPYIKTYFAAEKLTEKSEFESAEEKKLRIEKEVEKLVKIKDDLNATGVFIYEKYLRENEELIGELHGKNMEIVTKFLKDSEKFGTVALNADFIAVDLENYSEFTGMVEALKASDIDGGNRAYSYALGAGILLSLVLGAELEAIYLASALIFSWLFWRMFLATGFYPVMFPRVVVYITLIGGMLMFGFVPADDMGRVVAAMIGFPAGFGVFVLSARKMIEDFQREQLRVEGEWNDRFNRDGGEKAVGIIVPSDFISVSRRYLSNAVIRAPPVKRFSVVLLFLLFVSAIVVIPASAAPDFFFDLFNKSLSELIGLGKAENLVDNFINAAILVAVIASLGEITGKVFHARKGIGVLFAVIVMTLAVMPGDILFWGIVLIGFIPGYFNGRDTSVGYPWSPSLQPVRLSDRDFALWAQDALNSIKDGRSEAFMARNDVGDLFKRYFFSMLLEARMYKSALIWAAIISRTFTASVMNYYPLEQMWAYIWFVPAAFVLGWSIGNLVRYIKG
ncbi:MAG: phosphotransferase, partial [Candidatus Colwellbacteria bacterium]|nr:phosphotransferase [Candidatus Colwellbacteria bacterium]